MIPVQRQPIPAGFDEKVRRPGERALQRKARMLRKRRDRLQSREFPTTWRKALGDLCRAYGSVCAYLGLYLHGATGNTTVDHFIAKTRNWRRAYDWNNFRLCAGYVNSAKGDQALPLDPFTLETGLFALELDEFQVVPGPKAIGRMLSKVERTIEVLKLNHDRCLRERREYADSYREGEVSWEWLQKRAPFVAQELARQGQRSQALPRDRRARGTGRSKQRILPARR